MELLRLSERVEVMQRRDYVRVLGKKYCIGLG